MKLDFCTICGATENLHHHHIIPKARGGDDEETNFITVCYAHHEMIHQIRPGTFNNMKELAKLKQKEGIERAKKEGKFKGRQPTIDAEKVISLWKQGLGATKIAKQMGIDRTYVYRLVPKNIRDEGVFKMFYSDFL